jgi:hypothetical protein
MVGEILQDVLNVKSEVKSNQMNLFIEGVGIAYTAVAKLEPNADPNKFRVVQLLRYEYIY